MKFHDAAAGPPGLMITGVFEHDLSGPCYSQPVLRTSSKTLPDLRIPAQPPHEQIQLFVRQRIPIIRVRVLGERRHTVVVVAIEPRVAGVGNERAEPFGVGVPFQVGHAALFVFVPAPVMALGAMIAVGDQRLPLGDQMAVRVVRFGLPGSLASAESAAAI